MMECMAKSTRKAKRARKRHAKSCDGKVPYSTDKSARTAAEKMRAKRGQDTIQAYECQHCGQWHLGNRSW